MLNDYFSWPKEKKGGRDHRVNTIDFLIEVHNLSEEMALTTIKGLIVDMEGILKSYLADVKQMMASGGLKSAVEPEETFAFQYVEALIQIGAGVNIWSLSSKRYPGQ
jgi:hypothetical protein